MRFSDNMTKTMANKRRESGVSLVLLAVAIGVYLPAARAQQQTTSVQTRVDVRADATYSKSPPSGGSLGKELALSVVPSWQIASKGAETQIDGNWQFSIVDYLRNKQPDRVLPSGRLNARRLLGDAGFGIGATVTAAQVAATPDGSPLAGTTTGDTYTNTTYRLNPFWERDLDGLTHVRANLDRSIQHTTQLNSRLAPRDDWHLRDDGLHLTRRAAPLGYEIDYRLKEDRIAGAADPALYTHAARYTAIYALTPEFNAGLILGRANVRIGTNALSETVRGGQFQWRPTERSLIQTEVTDRFYGRAWKGEITHRLRWLTLSLTADREETTSAQQNELPSTGIKTADIYSVTAQLKQSVAGRTTFTGRRNVLNFAGGMVRTSPLTIRDVAAPGPTTTQYYLDCNLDHRLTPFSTLSAGLRWSRLRTFQPISPEPTLSRDFSWRASVNTVLTPNTNATLGFRRLLAHNHNPLPTSNDESGAFVGLGHRF